MKGRKINGHLQVRWDQLPSSYFKTFRRLNPKITDLNLIHPGQTIRIPELPSFEVPEAESTAVAYREDQKRKEARDHETKPGEIKPDKIDPEEIKMDEVKAQGDMPEAMDGQKTTIGVESPVSPKPMEVAAADAQKPSPQGPDPGVSGTIADGTAGHDVRHENNPLGSGPISSSGDAGTRKSGVASRPARILSKDGVNIVTSSDVSVIPRWQNIVSVVVDQIGGKLLATGHCSCLPGASFTALIL